MALDVEAVLQAQRAELVLGQLAGEVAARLVAELGDPFVDDGVVEVVVAVHGADGSEAPIFLKNTLLCYS